MTKINVFVELSGLTFFFLLLGVWYDTEKFFFLVFFSFSPLPSKSEYGNTLFFNKVTLWFVT